MEHDQVVKKILAGRTSAGTIRSRESNTVEFKQSFNKGSTAAYAKTMAAYANNSGGYIIFGIQDSPRKIIGLKNDNFENLKQEVFTDAINSLFSPAIEWEMGTIVLEEEKEDGELGHIIRINAKGAKIGKPEKDSLYLAAEEELPAKEARLSFIPYYTWGNRGINEMCVWVRSLT